MLRLIAPLALLAGLAAAGASVECSGPRNGLTASTRVVDSGRTDGLMVEDTDVVLVGTINRIDPRPDLDPPGWSTTIHTRESLVGQGPADLTFLTRPLCGMGAWSDDFYDVRPAAGVEVLIFLSDGEPEPVLVAIPGEARAQQLLDRV